MNDRRSYRRLSLLLAAATLSAGALPAAAQIRGRCEGGKPPDFTGLPFEPLACPETAGKPEETPADAASNPPQIKKSAKPGIAKLSPAALAGRWDGVVIYGNGRFLVTWDIRKAKDGNFDVDFTAEDYRLHLKNKIRAALSPKTLKGHFSAKVRLEALPKSALKAEVRFGGIDSEQNQAAFDRFIELTYRGRAQAHRLLLSLADKDKLRYEYRDLAKRSLFSTGELRRSGP